MRKTIEDMPTAATVLDAIKAIILCKEINKIHPTHAMRMEVAKVYGGTCEQMDSEIKALLGNYTIVDRRTINDTAYVLTDL